MSIKERERERERERKKEWGVRKRESETRRKHIPREKRASFPFSHTKGCACAPGLLLPVVTACGGDNERHVIVTKETGTVVIESKMDRYTIHMMTPLRNSPSCSSSSY